MWPCARSAARVRRSAPTSTFAGRECSPTRFSSTSPGLVEVVADEPTAISVPVMNTGEETDTFTFDLADLPLGWTTTSSTQTLGAGAESTAMLQLTPAPNAPLGVYAVSVRGTSTTDPSVTSSASFLVEVIDVTPPEIEVTLTPDSLWPPNHKLVTIAAQLTVTDDYDPNPAVELVSVTSSEPDDGPGDGHTTGDIRGADIGTDDRSFQLRAERSGSGPGGPIASSTGRQMRAATRQSPARSCSCPRASTASREALSAFRGDGARAERPAPRSRSS